MRSPLPRLARCVRTAGLGAALAALVAGCSTSPERAGAMEGRAEMVFVNIRSGPTSGRGDAKAREAMFAGHMANIRRLAGEGKLLIAGPFDAPADKTWRGVFVFDVKTLAEAEALGKTDPGVQAGEFVLEFHRARASVGLRRIMDLERAMLAEHKGAPPADPKGPPADLREYVLVSAGDLGRARGAVGRSAWAGKVIWSAALTDSAGGVMVLDARDVAAVRAGLGDFGGGAVDGWWSSASVERLGHEPAAAIR